VTANRVITYYVIGVHFAEDSLELREIIHYIAYVLQIINDALESEKAPLMKSENQLRLEIY
jgi:hypothetical protein